jgi:hypothetical protein
MSAPSLRRGSRVGRYHRDTLPSMIPRQKVRRMQVVRQLEFRRFKKAPNQALRWNVRAGTASAPIAKFGPRLCARLSWHRGSIVRKMAQEPCNLPRRIQASGRPSYRGLELRMSLDSERYDGGEFDQENRCLHSCINDIQWQSRGSGWVGHLERQTDTQSSLPGTAWTRRNICSEAHNGESAHPQRC